VKRTPPNAKVVPCKGCGQLIFFALTPLGKLMPLDVSSLVYEVASGENDRVPTLRIRDNAWISHYRTCTKASQFSRSGSSSPAVATEGPCPPSTSTPAS